MERVDELKSPPVIGKYYLVPCVQNDTTMDSTLWDWWIPIIGPPHDDAAIIGLDVIHYHHDVRFTGRRMIYNLTDRVMRRGSKIADEFIARLAMIRILPADWAIGTVVYRRMKCLREMPDFPDKIRGQTASWSSPLQNAYSDQRLQCGKCPHRGIDLSSMPSDGGLIRCPGHGLIWDAKTGAAVSRAEAERRLSK